MSVRRGMTPGGQATRTLWRFKMTHLEVFLLGVIAGIIFWRVMRYR